jgi:hypothetical protein
MQGGILMKKKNNYFKEKKVEEITDITLTDYEDIFLEGWWPDTEISNEIGVNEDYIKDLMEEYQSDYLR